MPAGDQPKAIEELTNGIDAGEKFQTLLGVTGSGKTYTIANVIAKTGRPAIPSNRYKLTADKPILYPKLKPKSKTTNVCIVIGTG